MSRSKLLLIVCFLVTFAAGVAAGLLAATLGRPTPHGHGRSWLMEQLDLSDTQRAQMKEIWSKADEAAGGRDRRRALAEARDKAVAELIGPDRKDKYDAVLKDYNDRIRELGEQRKKAFEQAVERTRAILTPAQAARYDELMKKEREQREQRERGRRGPASRPASIPAREGGEK